MDPSMLQWLFAQMMSTGAAQSAQGGESLPPPDLPPDTGGGGLPAAPIPNVTPPPGVSGSGDPGNLPGVQQLGFDLQDQGGGGPQGPGIATPGLTPGLDFPTTPPGTPDFPGSNLPLPPDQTAPTPPPFLATDINPNDPNNNLIRGGVSMPLYPTQDQVFPGANVGPLTRVGQFFQDAAGNLYDAAGRLIQAAGEAFKNFIPPLPAGYNPTGGLPPGFTENPNIGGGAPIFTPPGFTGPNWGPGGSIFTGTLSPTGWVAGGGNPGNLGGGGGNLGEFANKIGLSDFMHIMNDPTLDAARQMWAFMNYQGNPFGSSQPTESLNDYLNTISYIQQHGLSNPGAINQIAGQQGGGSNIGGSTPRGTQ